MGLLTNVAYWAEKLDALEDYRPEPGKDIRAKNATEIRRIGCKALTELLDCPEFQNDVKNATQKAMNVRAYFESSGVEFAEFTRQLLELEKNILKSKRRSTKQIDDLIERMRISISIARDFNFERFRELLFQSKKTTCSDISLADPNANLAEAVLFGVSGLFVSAVNVGSATAATVTIGPIVTLAAKPLASASVGAGMAMVYKGYKNWW